MTLAFYNFTRGTERHSDLPKGKQLKFELMQFGGQSPHTRPLYDAATLSKTANYCCGRPPLRPKMPAYSLMT